MRVSIVTGWEPTQDQATIESTRRQGIIVEVIGPVSGPLGRCRDMNALVRRGICSADVVHIHGLWEEILHQAAVAARERAIPYLIVPHGMLDPWSLAQSRWKKRLYMRWRLRKNLNEAAALHYITTGERDLAARLRLKPPAIVEGIGLDWREFEVLPPRGSFRRLHPGIGTRPMLLYLSRLHYKKGLDFLVPAFGQLRNREAVLVIAGPDFDGYRAVVEQKVAEAKVADRVIFTGILRGAERVAAMADADLFVLPSRQENFGVVVAESLAAGTPVIISDRVNLHPEIAAAEVGAVIPLDRDALTATLDQWLADDELRRTAADRARPFARARFDWGRIAAQWSEHYRRLAAAQKPDGT